MHEAAAALILALVHNENKNEARSVIHKYRDESDV